MRRIDQLLSSLGYCSRREAKAWLADGRVTGNGKPVRDPAFRGNEAELRVDGEPLDHPEGLLLMMNKPAGVVCSHEAREGPRIYDLLPERWRRRNPPLVSIGRLDRETTGLLLITDQTALVHRLTSPKRKLPKVYRARLEVSVPADKQGAISTAFASGRLMLDGEKDACLPAHLDWRGPSEALATLIEGRYHQVRRMFAAQGCPVSELVRESFGSLRLADLKAGEWVKLDLNTFF